MPRVTKADLERENVELKAELEKARDRSRSRNRKVHVEANPLSAAGYMALEIVCKHDRDPVIEEQRAIIARLRKEHAKEVSAKDNEIKDLKLGKGPIGLILLANRGPFISEDSGMRETLMSKKETVAAFVQRVEEMSFCVHSELSWGHHSSYFVRQGPN